MANIYVDLKNGEIPAIPFATGKIFDANSPIDKSKIPIDPETTDTNDNIDEKIASDNNTSFNNVVISMIEHCLKME